MSKRRQIVIGGAVLLLLAAGAAWWLRPGKRAMPDVPPSVAASDPFSGSKENSPGIGWEFTPSKETLEEIIHQPQQVRVEDARAYAQMSAAEKRRKLDADIDTTEQLKALVLAIRVGETSTSGPAITRTEDIPTVRMTTVAGGQRFTIRLSSGELQVRGAHLASPPADERLVDEYARDLQSRRVERGIP